MQGRGAPGRRRSSSVCRKHCIQRGRIEELARLDPLLATTRKPCNKATRAHFMTKELCMNWPQPRTAAVSLAGMHGVRLAMRWPVFGCMRSWGFGMGWSSKGRVVWGWEGMGEDWVRLRRPGWDGKGWVEVGRTGMVGSKKGWARCQGLRWVGTARSVHMGRGRSLNSFNFR